MQTYKKKYKILIEIGEWIRAIDIYLFLYTYSGMNKTEEMTRLVLDPDIPLFEREKNEGDNISNKLLLTYEALKTSFLEPIPDGKMYGG